MASFNLQDYETVETRLAKFWEANPDGRIYTELVHFSEGQFIIKASVYRLATDAHPVATGYAEETVTTRGVNQTSALENGETSALGRCLANWIYSTKGARPSREEMQKVQRGQEIPRPESPLDKLTTALLAYSKDKAVRKAFVTNTLGKDVQASELTNEEITLVIETLTAATAPFTE